MATQPHICTTWDHHVNDLLGIPFKYKSKDPDVGLDCWSLACLFQERLRGIHMHNHDEVYLKKALLDRSVAFEVHWHRIGDGEAKAQFGDILLFTPIGTILHVGVALDNQWMLHTTIELYSRPEVFRNSMWLPRLATAPYGIYRYTP